MNQQYSFVVKLASFIFLKLKSTSVFNFEFLKS